MFRQYNQHLSFVPRDGMAVILTGSVSIFVRDGAYQFYATDMRADGVGDLYARFIELKEKLDREGLFDQQRKKPLPLMPRKVGVVTSSTGAVIHDILNVSGKRNPAVPILLVPVRVQGLEAAAEIAAGINILSQRKDIDVIIVGRGGGSLEDLWPFNEEIVARTIAACPVPIVSAVGHETDFTIADFAADLRAATPSQAAEFVFKDVRELLGELGSLMVAMENALQQKLLDHENRLRTLETRLIRQSPRNRLEAESKQVALLKTRLNTAAQRTLDKASTRLEKNRAKLMALGPAQVLARGYTLTLRNGKPVTGACEIDGGERLELVFHDGQASVITESVEVRKDGNNAS